MDFWVTLGIDETKDEEAINSAYREKLRLVHPEEHPEEFMQLRAAYDEAIKFARASQEEQTDQSPIGLWVARAREIYENFSRRIDIDQWRELLNDEICQGLDSRIDARDALLKMCMECVLLPSSVWVLFDEVFALRENKEELYERFPKGFIDNDVILGMEAVPIVPYNLFDKDFTGNPDKFIDLYLKARRERQEGNLEACEATVADLENSGIVHPYMRMAKAELAAAKGDFEYALTVARELKSEYPEDTGIRMLHGDMLRHNKTDYETAIEDYDFVLSVWSNNMAKWGKAECLKELGKYEDAKALYIELHYVMPFNEAVSERVDEMVRLLSEQYEKQIAENPDDFELRMDYAWSCLQKNEKDKAKEVIAGLVPADDAQRADFENFSTKLYLNCDEFEEGLAHAEAWEQAVKLLPEGKTEKEKKRKGKLGEIYSLQAKALVRLERLDEALDKAEQSVQADPDDDEGYQTCAHVYFMRRDYEKAIEYMEKVCQLKPTYMSWYSLAISQYEMGDKQSAYHSLGTALEYARVLQAYTFRGLILCEYGEWDMVRQLIEFLEQNGVPEDNSTVQFLKARVSQSEGDTASALEIYKSLVEEKDSDERQFDFIWEVYRLIADIEDDNGKPADELLPIVDKGLEEKKDYLRLLELKSYLLFKARKPEEGIELNKHILELVPHHRYSNERIGDYLYEYYDDYEQALEYYYKQERVLDSAPLQEYIGLCLMYLERYAEAEPHFVKAMEMDPNRLRARSNLGLLYERQFDYQRSLPYQLKCVAIDEENGCKDRTCRVRLARTYARLGQHDKAIEAHKQSYDIFGEDQFARKMVEMLMESGRFDEAEKLLNKIHSEGKCKDEYCEMIADIRRLMGKEKDYLKLVEKMEGNDSKKLLKLAEYYYDINKYSKSLEYFDKLNELDGSRVDKFFSYIRLLRKLGRKDEMEAQMKLAFEEIDKMKNQRYQYALYLTKMAFVYLAAGMPEEAKPYIDRAIKAPMCDRCTYSRCKDAYVALSEYYQLLGDFQRALDLCREGQKIAPDEYDFIRDIKRLKKEHKLK